MPMPSPVKDTKVRESENTVSYTPHIPQKPLRFGKGSDEITWGILLIAGGIVFLLNNLGIVPWNVWRNLVSFWPILLILAGIQVILGNSIVSRVIMALLTFLIIMIVTLFAITTVNPELNSYIPSFLQPLFAIMENIKR